MKKVIEQMGWPVVAVGAIWAVESLLNIAIIVKDWL